MQPLDYQTRVTVCGSRSGALFVLPAAGAAVTLVAAGHSILEEPFGLFDVTDALIQVGSPVIAVGLWVVWLAVARRRGVRVSVLLASLGWAAGAFVVCAVAWDRVLFGALESVNMCSRT